VDEADILSDYLIVVQDAIDLEVVREGRLHILHDPIHGAAANLLDRILGDQAKVTSLRREYNPSFGSVNPEPILENLHMTETTMRYGIYSLAICNDGDADRLGVMDERGEFVTPHQILGLLTLDMVRRKGGQGEIVRTFSTTDLLDRIGEQLGVIVHETPIGFKHVADLMLERDIMIGGEESGGVGFGDFLPERDGILSGLRVAECIAAHGKPLSELVAEMEEEFGPSRYGRRDVRGSMERAGELIEEVRNGDHDDLFGSDFAGREEKDGVKLRYGDGTWILFRRSGTEPLIRIYCESAEQARVDENLRKASELV
ncbi:MAG: phosphoglucomutase/phosphomannomutase family protein, partial [Thermoanaerobaculia bacterium]|nr:phosphoglucomutase/phosphomannomutase family protein [Thermoanaerobaculia bacterium]